MQSDQAIPTVPACEKCGEVHRTWRGKAPGCTGHKRGTNPPEPCTNDPVTGYPVCRMHGAGGGANGKRVQAGERQDPRMANIRHGLCVDPEKLPPALQETYLAALSNPRITELNGEIALARAWLVEVIGTECTDDYPLRLKMRDVERVLGLIGGLAGKQSRIQGGVKLQITHASIDLYLRRVLWAVERVAGPDGKAEVLRLLAELDQGIVVMGEDQSDVVEADYTPAPAPSKPAALLAPEVVDAVAAEPSAAEELPF